MKRGRYALLKMIYSKTDYLNKIEQLKNLFNIPQEVLNNASYTKMHDTLAVKLFSLDNLFKAYNNSLYSETIFMYPFSLLGCSVNNRNLNISERIFIYKLIKNYCQKVIICC